MMEEKKKGNTEVNFLIPEENFEISGILSAETELACALTNWIFKNNKFIHYNMQINFVRDDCHLPGSLAMSISANISFKHLYPLTYLSST